MAKKDIVDIIDENDGFFKIFARMMINFLTKAKQRGLTMDDVIKVLRDTFETNK